MYKNARYRLQFWTDFHKIHMVGAGPLVGASYCFWKQSGPIEPQIWGKMCPQNQFFGFKSGGMRFFGEKTWKPYSVPHFLKKKGYIQFCRPKFRSLKKSHAPEKLFFAVILENVVFFKKIIKWKIFKTSMPTKKVILIFVAGHLPSPQNSHVSNKWVFRSSLQKCCFFSKNLFYNKIFVSSFVMKKVILTFCLRSSLPLKKWSNASPEQFFAVSAENTPFPEKSI